MIVTKSSIELMRVVIIVASTRRGRFGVTAAASGGLRAVGALHGQLDRLGWWAAALRASRQQLPYTGVG